VGTDWLVERQRTVPRPAVAAPAGNVTIGRWALGMLVALLVISLLVGLLAWYAGRRSAR